MSNDDLKDIKSEKKIKIPYFVEYPTDKVVEEPDVTKEDLAKSILSELGFFSSNDSTPNTSVNTTPVTSSNTTVDIVDNSVENISSVHFESNLENSFDSNENERDNDNSFDSDNTFGTETTDNILGNASETTDSKEYLVKTTIIDRFDNMKNEQESSILSEQTSPVVGKQRVRWFPNYISRSLSQLHYYLKMSDIILDVRDGRIPYIPPDDYFFNLFESEFPTKPRITVFTHSDKLPKLGMAQWLNYYRTIDRSVHSSYNSNIKNASEKRVLNRSMFVDAINGLKEIIYLRKHIFRMCRRVNERRLRKGLNPREIRVILMGMPNVGKSSLVNRLLGRKVTKSYNVPGLTKNINIYKSTTKSNTIKNKRLLLIDTPGIVHTNLIGEMKDNLMLIYSGLNIISECAYEDDEAAIAILKQILKTMSMNRKYVEYNINKHMLLKSLFDNFNPNVSDRAMEFNISASLDKMTKWFFGDNLSSCCSKLLNDFRRGRLGKIMLQTPPLSLDVAAYNRHTNARESVDNSVGNRDMVLQYKRGLYEGW
eukprot:XP_763794.1 hypothetical protein [Theileria parva strain Muguga]